MKCLPVILPYVIPEISKDCSTFILNNQVVQNFLEFFTLEDEDTTILRDSGTTHSMTQRYVIEELNLPIYRSENLKPCVTGKYHNHYLTPSTGGSAS
jgi:hypothetical protein